MDESRQSGAFPCHLGGETAGCYMISGAGLCWQHVGGVGSTTTTTTTEKALTELLNCPSEMLRLVCGLNTDSKEAECGMCMRGSDGRLCFSEK